MKQYDKWEDLTHEERIAITKERFKQALKNYEVYYNGKDYKIKKVSIEDFNKE